MLPLLWFNRFVALPPEVQTMARQMQLTQVIPSFEFGAN